MIKKILIILLVAFSMPSMGQKVIKGKVIDNNTLEPLEYAVVTLGIKGPSAITDQQGDFELKAATRADSIRISFVGYHPKNLGLDTSKDFYLVKMVRGEVDLQSVTLQALPNNASFSIMSNIDLNMHALNSSQDLMRLVPGLSLMQHQGGGIADHIFFRGFDADHGTDVSVSVDGMPLNLVSQIHGQGSAYLDFRTADVLTRSEVKVEAGQFNTGRIMGAINLLSDKARQKGQSAYIAAEGNYTDGPFKYKEHLNRGNLFGKFITKITPKSQLKVTLSAFSSDWRSSGEIPLRAVKEGLISRWGYIDSAQGGNTSRTTAIARITTSLSDKVELVNQFYYSHYFFNLNYDETFYAGDSINGDQLRQREARDLAGYNGTLTKHHYFKNNGVLTSTAGLGFQWNKIYGSELSHTKNFNEVLYYIQHGNVAEWTLNGYLDEQYRIGKWLLDAGVRLDYLHSYYADLLAASQPAVGKAIASPKLNVEYTFKGRIQLYAKLGKGFHSNDAKVVAQNKGIDILPAAYGVDLGINWKPVPKLYMNVALWYLYLRQEFTYNGDDGTFEPGNPTRREGADLSARYQFTRWLYANFDINFCRARDVLAPKGNNYLPLAVPLFSTGGLYVKLPSGWNGGWSARYMKNRPANSDNSLVAQGYFLNDIAVNYTRKHYEIGLEIQNLFNARWRDAQYEVESRLKNETAPVDDISFTPGMTFFAKLKLAVFFQ
jgi:hypothetical protein